MVITEYTFLITHIGGVSVAIASIIIHYKNRKKEQVIKSRNGSNKANRWNSSGLRGISASWYTTSTRTNPKKQKYRYFTLENEATVIHISLLLVSL